MSLQHNLNVASSVASSTLSLWRGTNALYRKSVTQPELPIQLYEMENCPYCRVVRMALCELHLDIEVYPCPKQGQRWRSEAERIGGKKQFPLLVDKNNDTVMYETKDIVHYLFTTYLGKVPSKWQPKSVRTLIAASTLASALRGTKGLVASQNKPAAKLLTLYTFESSPYGRPVRDVMCELEIAYKLINIGKEQMSDIGPATRSWNFKPYKPLLGSKRETMMSEQGHIASPYLIDPNTGIAMAESEDIIAYLRKTYGA